MRSQYSVKVIMMSFLMLGMWACSSTSDQQMDDEMNVGNNNADAESINSAEGEEVAKDNEFAEGEEVNNAADNEFADNFANQGNNKLNLGNQATQQAATANTTLPANPAANPAATDLAAADAATTAPPPTTSVPTSGGVVKYVKASVSISDQPGGPSVGNLEQGDHPVVWTEGEYARTHSGRFLPVSSLSETGVGRERRSSSWRSGE